MFHLLQAVLVVLAQTVLLAAHDTATEAIVFNRDIRPLLADRCYQCHGPDEKKREAELRFDLEQDAKKDRGGYHAIVEGDIASSVMIDRITAEDIQDRMPPQESGESLTDQEIELLKRWIAAGASFQKHWSFQAPVPPSLPRVKNAGWPRNEIDYFILSRLEAEGLRPSPQADRNSLIRRLFLDLIGLPPTPDAVTNFLNDKSASAYEQLVDRLLDSVHFGERMGRHWLDLARYADSNGYANDNVRSIWPFRDWVIQAFNEDMPFDQFTIEQLAGDLLPNPTESQLVATGFHRNTPHQTEGGSDAEQYRVERTKNRTDTTGTVWLGLTVGCAQCHAHKFDPITQSEYYQLYAFFNNSEEPTQKLASPVEVNDEIDVIKHELAEIEKQKPTRNTNLATLETRKNDLQARLENLEASRPHTLVIRETSKPRNTSVQIRGDFLDLGPRVSPNTFAVLHPLRLGTEPPTRLDLANWLTSPQNPLTPRVQVNRMWQHLFGTGLVETENDFGFQGSLPTHPELLDYLATELLAGQWRMKRLYKKIVMSSTYRQSSHFREDLVRIDPKNKWLGRQNRYRVEGEIVRDLGLAASGLLSRKMGGPAVFPPIPPNVIGTSSANHTWPVSKDDDRYRRGIYTAIYRANVYPMLLAFDGPDRDNACTRRSRSNTPLQALTIANDASFVEMAQAFGRRILSECKDYDVEQRIRYASVVALSRESTNLECSRLLDFQESRLQFYQSHPQETISLAGEKSPELASWIAVARVILNLDEFITRE